MKKSKLTLLLMYCLLTTVEVGKCVEIEELLSEYEEVADISKKTRTESLGHYVVITRKELDMMQAHILSDVLKSVKLHSYIPNRFGIYQLTLAGSIPGVNTSYRMYIDDHEVSSIHTDNPFLMFDNYPLDGINHIEIYYGSGAVRLGNEPSLVIIKLYTKEPSRENSSTIRISSSTKKDYTLGFNDTRVIKDNISYNLMVNRSTLDFPSYYNGSISRDIKGSYLFLKLKYYDTTVDLSYVGVKRDAFSGLAPDFTPTISKTFSEDLYLNLTQRLLPDKSLKINLSVDLNRRTGEFENEIAGGGVFLPSFYPDPIDPSRIPIYYYEKRNLNKYTLYVSKEFKSNSNSLLIGGSVKLKENSIDTIKYTTITGNYTTDIITPLTWVVLYTAFIENQFNITDKNLFIASLKVDHYHRNGGYKQLTDYIARLGYISFLSDSLYIKGFLNRVYIPPSFYEIEMSRVGKNLLSGKSMGASVELSYKKEKHSINLFYAYTKTKDMIAFLPYSENIKKPLEGHYVSVDYQYKFNLKNWISIDLFKSFNNFDDMSSTDGGNLKMFNSTDRFDLYNELIYRKGFKILGKDIEDSLNYNVGITYKISNTTFIKLKGENILNSSPKSVFILPQRDVVYFPSFERKFVFTFEKVF